MPIYFAFGSNMSRSRLQARVGIVEVIGRATLTEHKHAFTKLGADGTGKGNIEPCAGAVVHGAAYRLSTSQWHALAEFEGGYRSCEVEIVRPAGQSLKARTFVAARPRKPSRPTDAYVDHYRAGVDEHGIDPAYLVLILS